MKKPTITDLDIEATSLGLGIVQPLSKHDFIAKVGWSDAHGTVVNDVDLVHCSKITYCPFKLWVKQKYDAIMSDKRGHNTDEKITGLATLLQNGLTKVGNASSRNTTPNWETLNPKITKN